jgi:hypothetical protein
MQHARSFDGISLSHGQAMFVIEAMHIADWLDPAGLNSILKKFRRHFIPFSEDELDKPRWEELRYGYEHLLEVCVALKMTADGVAFRHVVSLLTHDRKKLRSIYRRAFLEAEKGQGRPLVVRSENRRSVSISGIYLDFAAVAHAGGTLATSGPRALDPWEALERYMAAYRGLHLYAPIRLSQLATDVVRLANEAPVIKRGRKS